MYIPPDLANDIVLSIRDALHQEINFMDNTGTIIASSDPQRLHQFHAGALAVIHNRDKITVKSDYSYCGTKKGINVPVFFEDEIIGVIGITGEVQEVAVYGKLLQSMTEILIKDVYYRDLRHQKRTNERLLIENILSADFQKLSLFQQQNLLQEQAHTVVCAILSGCLHEQQMNRLHQILEAEPYASCFEKKAIYEKELIFFIKEEQSAYMNHCLENLKDLCPYPMHIGVGTSCTDNKHLAQSYEQAKTAASWGAMSNTDIVHYASMDMGILITHIPHTDAQLFLSSIFHDLTHKKIQEIIEILDLYEKHNGSLIRCAEELYIHKNSFHYKLLTIKKQTGLDPRNLHDYQLLKTASQLYRYTQFKANNPLPTS